MREFIRIKDARKIQPKQEAWPRDSVFPPVHWGLGHLVTRNTCSWLLFLTVFCVTQSGHLCSERGTSDLYPCRDLWAISTETVQSHTGLFGTSHTGTDLPCVCCLGVGLRATGRMHDVQGVLLPSPSPSPRERDKQQMPSFSPSKPQYRCEVLYSWLAVYPTVRPICCIAQAGLELTV